MRSLVPLALAISLTACATAAPEAMLAKDAVPATHTETNGDVITEYRVGTQLRVVKVVPSRGPTFYIYDRNGDGRLDNDKDGVSPVYWKLYSW